MNTFSHRPAPPFKKGDEVFVDHNLPATDNAPTVPRGQSGIITGKKNGEDRSFVTFRKADGTLCTWLLSWRELEHSLYRYKRDDINVQVETLTGAALSPVLRCRTKVMFTLTVPRSNAEITGICTVKQRGKVHNIVDLTGYALSMSKARLCAKAVALAVALLEEETSKQRLALLATKAGTRRKKA